MDAIKLVLVLVVLSCAASAPAHAKTSDPPAFGVWLAQWGKNLHQATHERLPCLRAATVSCNKALSSSVLGKRTVSRHAAVTNVNRPKRTLRTARRQLVFKKAQRVKTTTVAPHKADQVSDMIVNSSRALLLNDTGSRVLGDKLDEPSAALSSQFEALSEFVEQVEPATPDNQHLLADAAGGVGDSAFVSLYDFDAEGNAGEAPRSPQEITSLLSPQTMLTAAAAVPEPASLLLIGAGLLALRVTRRGRLERTGQLLPHF